MAAIKVCCDTHRKERDWNEDFPFDRVCEGLLFDFNPKYGPPIWLSGRAATIKRIVARSQTQIGRAYTCAG